MGRVGLLGGTFDPPHDGHVSIAQQVADALSLDRVEWIVSGNPPHKPRADLTDAETRLEMVRAACSTDDRFVASTVELERPGPSYTVDTVRELTSTRGDDDFYLILGADQVAALDSWKAPEEILGHVRLAVVDRDGSEIARDWPEAVRSLGAEAVGGPGQDVRVVRVPTTRIPLSSSGIRRRIRGGDVPGGLPGGVLAVIEREGLYR